MDPGEYIDYSVDFIPLSYFYDPCFRCQAINFGGLLLLDWVPLLLVLAGADCFY